MITTFTMNRKSAEKVAGFNGIDKSGKYVGTLTQVEVAESKAGATYVEFAFQTIGLLLQRENREYEHEGQIKTTYQMNIITPFHQVTGQNAKEVLNNLEAKAVEAKFKNLKDKEAKPVTPSAPVAHPYDDAPLDDNPF